MANEKRLIDADVLMEAAYDSDEKQGNDVWHTGDIEYLVMAQPIVDAVEVVRCKDCKHATTHPHIADYQKLVCTKWINWRAVEPKHFCSYGERKDNV